MNIKENNKKMIYESPTVEIKRVVLEQIIAMSTINKVDLNSCVEESQEVEGNNSGI